jgi:hypothetical protein
LRALRGKLTYANVTATLALFVAVGGTSFAAVTINGANIKDQTITGRKLARNTVGGSRINEATLRRVPHARNADLLGGAPAATYRVRCSAGTIPVSGICIETQARPPAPYSSAATDCALAGRPAGPGRQLPSQDELMTALGQPGITLASGGELTQDRRPPSSPDSRGDVTYITDDTGNIAVTPDNANGAKAFRCVTGPIN